VLLFWDCFGYSWCLGFCVIFLKLKGLFMSAIDVLAGDFYTGRNHAYYPGQFSMTIKSGDESEKISACEVMESEVVTQSIGKKFISSLVCAVIGGIVLTPFTRFWFVGVVLGFFAGGWERRVTFKLKFKDGRRMLATTANDTYVQMLTDSWGS
jgi:hypothetical protein